MNTRRYAGVTLVEMMVVVALTALLLSLAAPSFQEFVVRRAVESHYGDFLQSMRFARSEAIKRGVPVTMCRVDDPNATTPACSDDAGGTDGWKTGWMVFADFGSAGSFDTGDVVLKLQQSYSNSGGIEQGDSSAAKVFTFYPNGIAFNAAEDFTFNPTLDSSRPDYADFQRLVCVSSQGKPRLMSKGTTTCS